MWTKNLDMIYSSWDKDCECDRLKLVIMGHFCPFTSTLKNQKIRILKKWKKLLEIPSFCIYVPKLRSYEVWFLKHSVRRQNFLSFWAIFCTFTLLTTSKIKISKKWKKHFTCRYQKSWSNMLPEIWSLTDIIFGHFG